MYLFRGSCDMKPDLLIRGPDKNFSMHGLPLWLPAAAERRAPSAAGSITGTQAGSTSAAESLGCMPSGHDLLLCSSLPVNPGFSDQSLRLHRLTRQGALLPLIL